ATSPRSARRDDFAMLAIGPCAKGIATPTAFRTATPSRCAGDLHDLRRFYRSDQGELGVTVNVELPTRLALSTSPTRGVGSWRDSAASARVTVRWRSGRA